MAYRPLATRRWGSVIRQAKRGGGGGSGEEEERARRIRGGLARQSWGGLGLGGWVGGWEEWVGGWDVPLVPLSPSP